LKDPRKKRQFVEGLEEFFNGPAVRAREVAAGSPFVARAVDTENGARIG